jgi:predicted nucleotidyltransferase
VNTFYFQAIDSQTTITTKKGGGLYKKLKNKAKANYAIHSLNKELSKYKEELTRYEYYNNVNNILTYFPNTELKSIKETAEYLKMTSLRYFIIDLFQYIFENYQLFNNEQEEHLKEAIDDVFPKEELGAYLNLFFTNGERLIINRVKREIITKYFSTSSLNFSPIDNI